MKITIFSDCHCGYAYGEERGEDPFTALQECMEKSSNSDLILIAGDIFDSRVPKQEVLARTARLIGLAQNGTSNARLLDMLGKDRKDISPTALKGVPVIAIHGTHERRGRAMVNPVQALEHAGLLAHLHCASLLFDVEGKRVAVHGMSGVPERFAKDCLMQWSPKPYPGAYNILMLHQSIDPYVYSPLEPPSLKLEDLPHGFDLYVLGHIHWHEQRNFKNGILLLAGSTVTTSVHKIEAEQSKGLFALNDTFIEFVPLQGQRKVICEDFQYNAEVRRQVEQKLIEVTSRSYRLKPLVIIRVKGKVPAGTALPNFNDLEQRYGQKAIVRIAQSLQQGDFERNADLLRSLREERLSPEEQGLRILQDNLDQVKCGLKAHELFDMLVEGRVDELEGMLMGEKR